jgi:hypothetical protein
MIRTFIFVFCFASTATAGCPPWKGDTVVSGRDGERLCAKHREALRKATVYGPDPAICILVQPTGEQTKARACSPNALPFGIGRTKTRLYSRGLETWYCRQCESFVLAHARK